MISYTMINKKEQAKKSSQIYMIPFTIIIKKSNKQKYIITLCIPKLLL